MTDKIELPAQAIPSLARHISFCFHEANTAKQQTINPRLLKCERARRGEYDPTLLALINQSGGQPIYMMLSDIKCRAAEAWEKDVILNHGESTWALSPTAEPELPPQITEEVNRMVILEAAELAAAGGMPDAEAMEMRKQEVFELAQKRVVEVAAEKCEAMSTRVTDKLQEGGWVATLSASLVDFNTYPACFVEGPVLRKEKVLKWGPNFQPIVTEEVKMHTQVISPWDVFPSKSAVTMQDGPLIVRYRLSRAAVRAMRDMPGADNRTIDTVLENYRMGLRMMLSDDHERSRLQGRAPDYSADGLIEVHKFFGPVQGDMLLEWGMTSHKGERIDPLEEYEIVAWMIPGTQYLLRVQINPDPLGMRPYSKACFEEIPGAFWGKALPELMEDTQTICNASARALVMNMGIASGPQAEVNVDRLPKGASLTAMYPWKVWPTSSDRSGAGHPAIRFHNPDMHAAELMQVYTFFSKQADDTTGVPSYIYGSSAVSGAGRTSSGLAMLMENAAKGIKAAILNFDAAMTDVIKRVYLHLMQYDPDPSIKGDMTLVPAGAIGALLREKKSEERSEFMRDTMNPIDAQIIGPRGRAYMLRERARGVWTDPDMVVPTDKQILAQQAAMAAQQAGPAPVDGAAPGVPQQVPM
jgi:hypothetical protein